MAAKKASTKKTPAAKSGSTRTGSDRIDAVTLLENDHQRVRELLEELEESTERSVKRRRELLVEIGIAIRVHAGIEEEIFYPAFRAAGETRDDGKLFFEAAEEHGLVDIVLRALEATEPDADEFGAKAKVLVDLVEHHAEEEEEEMFPRAKKLFGRERLLELGAELEARQTGLENEVRSGPMSGATRKTRGNGRAKGAGQPDAAVLN